MSDPRSGDTRGPIRYIPADFPIGLWGFRYTERLPLADILPHPLADHRLSDGIHHGRLLNRGVDDGVSSI